MKGFFEATKFVFLVLFASCAFPSLGILATTTQPNLVDTTSLSPAWIISTVAGGPLCGFSVAYGPVGVAVDGAGNQYFTAGASVCRLTRAGVPSVVAGNGVYGYAGDDGAATAAELDSPTGVALDSAGNLYIADYFNQRIRKVAVDGTISTVAGNGEVGYFGDGGAATEAELNRPSGVAVDGSGNIYIADSGNGSVRKVATNGIITTVTRALYGPYGITVDNVGNLYIADTDGNRVVKVTGDGAVSIVAGNPSGGGGFFGDGGAATAAELFNPSGVAVDSIGNLYISDKGNDRIRKVSVNGTIDTLAGNGKEGYAGDGGPANTAEFSGVWGIALDSTGNLYIADGGNYRVRRITVDGMIATSVGPSVFCVGYSGDGGPATLAQLSSPSGVAVDTLGNLFVADTSNSRIRKVATDGIITTVAGTDGGVRGGDGGAATAVQLSSPFDVALDMVGNVYIADGYENSIRKVTHDDVISTVAGNGTSAYSGDGGPATAAGFDPYSSTVDNAGNLYIADPFNNRIRKVGINGIITTVAGNGTAGLSGDGGAATSAQLSNPLRVAVDNAGNLYIADTGNNVVRKVATNGVISTVAGNGAFGFAGDGGPATAASLAAPTGLAIDGVGNLYIADRENQRIRKLATNGTISTVAGTGSPGFSGNGGPAANAQLNSPTGLAIDSAGNLFVADSHNNAVRKISQASLYVPLNPARLLDTRIGAGYMTVDGIAQNVGPIAPSVNFRLPVTGRATIPANISAVALNVTPINPASLGYFTVWSGVGTEPNASNLNFNPGYIIPNLVITPVDSSGDVAIFNGSNTAQDVAVDVQGYFPVGSAYVPMTPQRYLDTRSGYITADNQDQGIGALIGGGVLDLRIAGRTTIPTDGVDAAIFNLTAVQPAGAGYITVWPSDTAQPYASNLNLNVGLTIPNLVISGLGSGGVSLFNGDAKATDLLVDVQGWFTTGSGYSSVAPARLLDTRNGLSTIDGLYAGIGPLIAGGSLDLKVVGRGGIPMSGAGTVVLNVTSVSPTQPGYITVWPTGSALPLASNLNLNPGKVIANTVLAKIGSDGKVSIFNGSKAPTDVVVDIEGWMPAGP